MILDNQALERMARHSEKDVFSKPDINSKENHRSARSLPTGLLFPMNQSANNKTLFEEQVLLISTVQSTVSTVQCTRNFPV